MLYPNIDFIFGSVKKHWGVLHGYRPEKIFYSWGFYSSHSTGFFIKLKSAKKVKNSKTATKQKKVKLQKKIPKQITKLKAEKKESSEANTNALRISKSNEQKPEIKKVKKQDTEKKEYKIKEYVVYPKHGVGQIIEFKKMNIGGIEIEAYILKFEKDKANGMVPVNKQSHLRPLATINQVNKCISILKSKPKIKRSMWSRRAQ